LSRTALSLIACPGDDKDVDGGVIEVQQTSNIDLIRFYVHNVDPDAFKTELDVLRSMHSIPMEVEEELDKRYNRTYLSFGSVLMYVIPHLSVVLPELLKGIAFKTVISSVLWSTSLVSIKENDQLCLPDLETKVLMAWKLSVLLYLEKHKEHQADLNIHPQDLDDIKSEMMHIKGLYTRMDKLENSYAYNTMTPLLLATKRNSDRFYVRA
jgi:hypothetical protein